MDYDGEVNAKRTINKETLRAVGQHLRMLRMALGHSQRQWAQANRITAQMLNHWEHGTHLPDIDFLIRVCDSSRCTLDFIFRGRLGRDVDPELREKLVELYGSSFVLQFSPADAPHLPDGASDQEPASNRKLRVSTRRTPPTPRGSPSKPIAGQIDAPAS